MINYTHYTPGMAARRLNLSRSRIHQLIKAKLLTVKKHRGKANLIAHAELMRFSKLKRKAGRPKKKRQSV